MAFNIRNKFNDFFFLVDKYILLAEDRLND